MRETNNLEGGLHFRVIKERETIRKKQTKKVPEGNQSLTFFNGSFFVLCLRYVHVHLKGEEGTECVRETESMV